MLHKVEISRKPRQPSSTAPVAAEQATPAVAGEDPQRVPPSLRKFAHKDSGAVSQRPIDKLRADLDSGRTELEKLRSTFKGF